MPRRKNYTSGTGGGRLVPSWFEVRPDHAVSGARRRTAPAICGVPGGASMRGSTECSLAVRSSPSSKSGHWPRQSPPRWRPAISCAYGARRRCRGRRRAPNVQRAPRRASPHGSVGGGGTTAPPGRSRWPPTTRGSAFKVCPRPPTATRPMCAEWVGPGRPQGGGSSKSECRALRLERRLD